MPRTTRGHICRLSLCSQAFTVIIKLTQLWTPIAGRHSLLIAGLLYVNHSMWKYVSLHGRDKIGSDKIPQNFVNHRPSQEYQSKRHQHHSPSLIHKDLAHNQPGTAHDIGGAITPEDLNVPEQGTSISTPPGGTCQDTDQATDRAQTATTGTRFTPTAAQFSSGTATGKPKARTDLGEFWSPSLAAVGRPSEIRKYYQNYSGGSRIQDIPQTH